MHVNKLERVQVAVAVGTMSDVHLTLPEAHEWATQTSVPLWRTCQPCWLAPALLHTSTSPIAAAHISLYTL